MTNSKPEQLDPKTEETETSGILSKVKALQKEFYTACGDLYNERPYLGESMYNQMLSDYYEMYMRERDIMNAAVFIEVDKEIEQLKIKRDEVLAAIRLEHDKLRAEIKVEREKELEAIRLERDQFAAELEIERDKKLKEIELEHERQLAEIARKREKMYNETSILAETARMEAVKVAEEITPAVWRRFNIGPLHFGRVCTNRAMDLAMAAADTDISKHLLQREATVEEGATALAGEYGVEQPEGDEPEEQELVQLTPRQQRKQEKLERRHREALLKKIEKKNRKADKRAFEIAPEEPEDAREKPEEDPDEQTPEPEETAAGRETRPENADPAGPTVIHL